MNCKEFERQIPLFIKRKLDFYALREFCEHIDGCENCKEELVIQFLVTEGMQRLEEGDAFDLQSEMNQRLEEARSKTRFHFGFLKLGVLLEVLVVCAVAGAVVWFLI